MDPKGNKQWVQLALDVATREIIGCFIGDRSKESAQGVWESLPAVYRQGGGIYTDAWAASQSVWPSKRHRVVAKETGLASYIERFSNTLRQRVSRLVGKPLSFSKRIENHKAAIWNFIHHYNEQLRVRVIG